ncbi:hypothetical protein DL93DRAFT_2051382 [Clavulina sp. PMI_390]|nr:hypothetical protein DL93DRAFT_2051382 [Clavulina sp. PMI_390]
MVASFVFRLPLVLLVAQLAASATVSRTPAKRSYDSHDYYVLQLDARASATPDECANELGVELVEQVGELAHHYLVRVPSSSFDSPDVSSSPSKRSNGQISSSSPASDAIVERFHALRSFPSTSSHSPEARSPSSPSRSHERRRRISKSLRSLERQVPRQRTKKRAPIPERSDGTSVWDDPRAPVPPGSKSQVIAQELGIVDPIFNDQWHLANNQYPRYDLNVSGVWAQGVTGKGVITAVVDDGLDVNSDDLNANFWLEGSWDFNDHTNLPLPRLSDDQHGTRCCGEIAAVKNDVCGVGVAYESKISGIRILSGPISDADEAAALNYGFNTTSIYSCSWGPPDDGRSMEAPNILIRKAVLNGVNHGRGGKGSIFVFASGNGAGSGDQCNFDGYTNSIYSVTVAAVDHAGMHPYYSEACAANLIVAYSSGGGNRIYTTDVGKNKCTSGHGGTSAAAPLGTGTIALALQVRPELTWRDVQHIVLRSAQIINPDDPDWEKTASGRLYSYKYGYGALDAWTLVELARTWPLVKKQAWIEMPQVEIPGSAIDALGVMTGGEFIGPNGVESKVEVTEEIMKSHNFENLEHITVQVWISHHKRGDVEVEIESPSGIKSILGGARRFDTATTGYPGWKFMSVKHWGENPVGTWTLRVKDQQVPNVNGSFLGWTFNLWGECIDDSKAKLYVLPEDMPESNGEDHPPPLTVSFTTTESATSTGTATMKLKPTNGLPDDHDLAQGDNKNPAFPNQSTSTAPPSSPSHTVAPDEGYFDHIGDLLNSSTWLIVALVLTAIFASAAGLFFWRRRAQRLASSGAGSGGDDMAMGIVDDSSHRLLGGGPRGPGRRRAAGELYDALGEVSDDDEEENEYADARMYEDEEERRAREAEHPGLRYHDEFLEDDTPDSAAVSPRMGTYRDDVGRSAGAGASASTSELPPREKQAQGGGAKSTTTATGTLLDVEGTSTGSGGSGDSWEHASADVGR